MPRIVMRAQLLALGLGLAACTAAPAPTALAPAFATRARGPAVAAGGDPAGARGSDGTAYSVWQGFDFTSPFQMNLLLSRSTDGGRSWLKGGTAEPLTVIASWNGNGKTKGSNGQFTDHEALWI